MKVLVLVTQVAILGEGFAIEDGEIEDRYFTYDFNEWDEYALETGVQLTEERGGEVVTVTIGPERSEETIRTALAKGADRAIRIWDDSLAGASFLDVSTKAAIFSAAIGAEEPDIVLCGVQTGDDSFGATGVATASTADFEWAAVVNRLDLESEKDEGDAFACVRRELEGGVEELLEVDLPAVCTIQTGINEPRYASLRGIRQAQSVEIEEYGLADLGLDPDVAESPLEIASINVPEVESDATMFEGPAAETVPKIADVLRGKGVGQ